MSSLCSIPCVAIRLAAAALVLPLAWPVATWAAQVATAQDAPAPRASAPQASMPQVTVRATRDPVEKSYRKMVHGMDVFERLHAMAPQATLRYKLLPRQPGTPLDGIVLKVMGDSVTLNVPIAADYTFTLPRDKLAYDEDAQVIPNRKTRSMTWRTDIRTPGLPPNVRRLGDLRLECEVGVEANLLSENLPLFGTLARLMSGPEGICRSQPSRYLLFADKPVFGVTLVHGERRWVAPVTYLYLGQIVSKKSEFDLNHSDAQSLVDRTYAVPLGDRSWPDDTLVVFDWIEDGA